MRLTLFATSTAGLKASILEKNRRRKQRLVEATAENAEDLKETAQGLAEVDTGFYRDNIRVEIGGDGKTCRVGVRASDFIGHVNPVSGLTITFFYPLVLVKGGRHRIGNDIFTAALELRRAQILGRYAKAMRDAG